MRVFPRLARKITTNSRRCAESRLDEAIQKDVARQQGEGLRHPQPTLVQGDDQGAVADAGRAAVRTFAGPGAPRGTRSPRWGAESEPFLPTHSCPFSDDATPGVA